MLHVTESSIANVEKERSHISSSEQQVEESMHLCREQVLLLC